MKTTRLKTSRLRILCASAVLGVCGLGSTAQAQIWDFGPFWGWPPVWYPTYGENGSTAYESFLRGEAAAARAEGERALSFAQAQVHYEDAIRKRLENREKAFEQRHSFRRQGMAQRDTELETVRAARSMKMALNEAERMLDRSRGMIREDETRAEAKLRIAHSLVNAPANEPVAVSDQQ